MSDQPKYQQFIDYLVKMLVDHPNDVSTERTVDERGVLLTLHLNPADMGQIIGRQGQTARAIRTLLRVVGAKEDARVNLKIFESDEQRQAHLANKGSRAPQEEKSAQGPMDELEV